mmetsp:Transcript_27312/g.42476  ORF Transcript_27312/g.42476 Transcript_27312/m.42476 type:complete len:403 (-) Transcript_27312:130-1338(-)
MSSDDEKPSPVHSGVLTDALAGPLALNGESCRGLFCFGRDSLTDLLCCGRPQARQSRARRAQKDENVTRQEAEREACLKELEDKYTSCHALKEVLAAGDTVLVKGSWLIELWERGSLLPRRQEVPTSSIWNVREFMDLFEAGSTRLISISHCWLSTDHPDPHGEQLATLAMVVKQFLEAFPIDDCGIFLDWCSLLQHPRYVHQSSHVWMLTKVPSTAEIKLPYGSRGWPMFERSLSQMIIPSSRVLDLGKFDATCTSWLETSVSCRANRYPPMAPEVFVTELRKKAFSQGAADRSWVIERYAETFAEVICSAEELHFNDLGWGDAEMQRVVDVVCRCLRLRGLFLNGNIVTDEGASKLADALPVCKILQDLRLDSNKLTESGKDKLREAWRKCGKVASRIIL